MINSFLAYRSASRSFSGFQLVLIDQAGVVGLETTPTVIATGAVVGVGLDCNCAKACAVCPQQRMPRGGRVGLRGTAQKRLRQEILDVNTMPIVLSRSCRLRRSGLRMRFLPGLKLVGLAGLSS
jgi:hypothetical protein